MTIFLVSLASIFWGAGFLSMKGLITLNADSMFEMNRVVVPPKWLYYLCGAPKSKICDPGAITVGALRAQLAGIAFGIFSLASYIWRLSQSNLLFGFSLCLLVPYLITLWISNRKEFAYKERKKKNNPSR